MQFQPPPLRKRLLTSMLPRLFGLILVVALMLFAFAFFFAKQQIETVQQQSMTNQNFCLDRNLVFVAERVERKAAATETTLHRMMKLF